MLQVNNGLVVF